MSSAAHSSGSSSKASGSTSSGTSESAFEAAKKGDVEFLQTAVLNGVDVNQRDSSGESALMIAAQHGREEAVRWLALAGARTEDTDRALGTTALMFACIGGHHLAVRELLAAGAAADVRFDSDDNKVTPLMFAVQYCGVARLRKKEPWAKFGATILELLRGGATVDLKDKRGRTALTFAAELGHPEVTSWLLKAGADVEATDENGTSPLMFACRGGHALVFPLLLEAGADPVAATSKGSTPLHFAASAGCSPIMRQLLDRGANVDAKTEDGDTALNLAISAGAVGSVGFLVKAGAALDLEDKEGRSCLDLAAVMFSLFPEEARQVIIRFLQNNGAAFKLIDADVIDESHRAVAALGVKTDEDGKFSVAAGDAAAATDASAPAPPAK
ncbi:unnamed protein product [Scytosiphon promiscuus]